MDVNPTKEKKLTNMRQSSGDVLVPLIPHRVLSLEQALEFCREDECVEVTPATVRHPQGGPARPRTARSRATAPKAALGSTLTRTRRDRGSDSATTAAVEVGRVQRRSAAWTGLAPAEVVAQPRGDRVERRDGRRPRRRTGDHIASRRRSSQAVPASAGRASRTWSDLGLVAVVLASPRPPRRSTPNSSQ